MCQREFEAGIRSLRKHFTEKDEGIDVLKKPVGYAFSSYIDTNFTVSTLEMAVKLCLTPDAIENVYKKAIKKMRKYFRRKYALKTEKARIYKQILACIFGLDLYIKIHTFVKKQLYK